MTTYNILSTVITNRDATPKVFSEAYLCGGAVKQVWGQVQTHGAADGVGSTYRLLQIPSNARVSAMVLQAEALGTGCTLSVGVWYPTFIPVGSGLSAANQSLVINTTLFVSALGCSAATAATNLVTPANITIANQEKQLWDAAGLTSDPGIDLDIVVYVAGAVAAQGYVALKSDYVL